MSSHQDATTSCRHLGRQIRGIREGRGISDRDLVVKAGMLPSTVAAIENGWDGITIGTIARLVNALGCELSITPRGATLTPIADRLAKQEPLCNCGHTEEQHYPECCKVCDGDSERAWRHRFTPADGGA